MERIQGGDTMPSALHKMSEGNFGALRVCADLLQKAGEIDPDSGLGGVGPILHLDSLGLYGPRIWMLYSHVCGGDLVVMVGLLRASQLGFVSEDALKEAVENYGRGIDVDDLLRKVRSQSPRFASDPGEEAREAA